MSATRRATSPVTAQSEASAPPLATTVVRRATLPVTALTRPPAVVAVDAIGGTLAVALGIREAAVHVTTAAKQATLLANARLVALVEVATRHATIVASLAMFLVTALKVPRRRSATTAMVLATLHAIAPQNLEKFGLQRVLLTRGFL